jgi:hypothetical protein
VKLPGLFTLPFRHARTHPEGKTSVIPSAPLLHRARLYSSSRKFRFERKDPKSRRSIIMRHILCLTLRDCPPELQSSEAT